MSANRRFTSKNTSQMTRRDVLRYLGAAGLVGATGISLAGRNRSGNGGARSSDVEIVLTAKPAQARLLSGEPTRVLRFGASVARGDPSAVAPSPGGYLGPTLRFHKGQRVRVRFDNRLAEPSIVHWHGLHVPDEMDGHPRFAVAGGNSYDYEFTVDNRAGTYWYHPHPHGRTGRQIYHGLAGLLLISDDEERSLGLPQGERDIALVIQDRTFDADNQLRALGGGMMMERMMGFLGKDILVNGQPHYTLTVSPRAHRLRLLNASNARLYKLAWSDGTPLHVIATDGGLLARPLERAYVMLAPGERVELWADFSRYADGGELALKSLPFEGGMAMRGMMGGMMGGEGMMNGMMGRGGMMGGMMGDMMSRMNEGMMGGPANGRELDLLTVRIARGRPVKSVLPRRLAHVPPARVEDARNRRDPRTIRLAMGMMEWTLNGRTFEMNAAATDEHVALGTTEVWEFANDASMGMMGMMAHPMHIHGVQFRVIGRDVLPEFEEAYDTVREGYVDEGWKDTVLVMPGERVQLLIRFEDYAGLFPYHCHNLEHADLGMMRNYWVG